MMIHIPLEEDKEP